MTRTLYRSLLLLHPPAFRRRFATEMLWIFDESTACGGPAMLLDGFVSLVRQWMVGSGGWKVLVALLGGLLQILAFTRLVLETPGGAAPQVAPPGPTMTSDLDFSRALVLLVIVLVLSTAALCIAGRPRSRYRG